MGLPEQCEMGLAQGVNASLEVLVLCKGVQLDFWIPRRCCTLGQFCDLAWCDLAQTFACRLDARVEALCKLVGRLAEIQVGEARL